MLYIFNVSYDSNLTCTSKSLTLTHLWCSCSRSLTYLSHYPSHSHCHTLSAVVQPHRSRSRYHSLLTLVVTFLQSLSSCRSRSLTLVLSLTHEKLVFYQCLFLCLVLMVMVSEKLGLVLGFDGDGNACFCVYVCIASW